MQYATVQKKSYEKIYQRKCGRKMEFFTLITVSKILSNFYKTKLFCFYLHFLITIQPDADETVEKNEKRVYK
jgi:hypothetical protein